MKTLNNEIFLYSYEDKVYKVIITYKKGLKNIYFRINENIISISSSKNNSKEYIFKSLKSVMPSLIKKSNKEKQKEYYNDQGIYLLGEFIPFNNNKIKFNGKTISFNNIDNFYLKIKPLMLNIFEELMKEVEKETDSKIIHTIDFKKVKTYFAVNYTKKHQIIFNYVTIHYSKEIIKSLIIHELMHDYIKGHGEDFYKLVYKNCPNYKELNNKLKKGVLK